MIELDGNSLVIEDLISIGMGVYSVKLSDQAIENVKKSRKVIDDILRDKKGTDPMFFMVL